MWLWSGGRLCWPEPAARHRWRIFQRWCYSPVQHSPRPLVETSPRQPGPPRLPLSTTSSGVHPPTTRHSRHFQCCPSQACCAYRSLLPHPPSRTSIPRAHHRRPPPLPPPPASRRHSAAWQILCRFLRAAKQEAGGGHALSHTLATPSVKPCCRISDTHALAHPISALA